MRAAALALAALITPRAQVSAQEAVRVLDNPWGAVVPKHGGTGKRNINRGSEITAINYYTELKTKIGFPYIDDQ